MVTATRERERESGGRDAVRRKRERERSRVVNDAVYCPEVRIFCCESPIRGWHAASRLSSRLLSLFLSLSPSFSRPRMRERRNERKIPFFLFFRERESVIRAGDSRQRRKSGADNWPLKHAPRGLMHIIASIMRLRLLRPLSRPATRALANFPSMT